MTEPIAGEVVFGEVELRGEGVLVGRTVPLHEQIAARWLLTFESENTVAAYRRDVRDFFAWCAEFGFDPLTLGRTEANGYRRQLDRRLANATRARRLSGIASFYVFGMQNYGDLIPANPFDPRAVKRPKVPTESKTVGLTLEQAGRLFMLAAEDGLWEHAAVRVLLHTGMRVSELVGAETGDLRLEPDGWTVEIRRKGGRSSRVPLVDVAYEAVRAYTGGRSGPILLSRTGRGVCTRQQVGAYLAKLARRAGDMPHLHPHALRHTAATLYWRHTPPERRDPVRMQQLLGHAQLTTTMRYIHAAEDMAGSAAHDLAAVFRGAGS